MVAANFLVAWISEEAAIPPCAMYIVTLYFHYTDWYYCETLGIAEGEGVDCGV